VKNWGAITDWFKGVWSGFCDGIQTAWIAVGDFFTQTLPNFFSDVGQKWSDGWNTMKTNAGTIWDNIKTGVGNSIDNIKTSVGNGLDNVKQSFSDKLSAAHDTAASIMENIRGAFSDKMSAARDGVSNAIDAIKGFFNFDWHLPEIKLPHFSIEGSFSLDPPSIPHIGVSWYKKAMGDGMVLNSPTIFGAQGGQLLAGGEAGSEAIVGVNSLSSMIQNAVAAQTGSITAAIVSAIAGASNTGDITIPVYIGNEQIDTIVVKASQRVNYRSGGR
jgi:phage-related minor tail protein